MRELLADLLIILGILTITFGVVGIIRAPTIYTRLHAASKAVVLGVVSFCAAAFLEGGATVQMRVILIALFLVITTPVASHVIARSAYQTGED